MLFQFLQIFLILLITLEKITDFTQIDCSFGLISSKILNFFQIDCESHKQSLIIYSGRLLGVQTPPDGEGGNLHNGPAR